MRKSCFSETQIVAILKEADVGMKVADLCRKHSISDATYYKWKSKFGGMEASDLKRVRELEAENAKLKQMYHVYRLMDLHLRRSAKRRLPKRLRVPLYVSLAPDTAWSDGFMSDTLTDGRRFRTFKVVGDFNREALHIEIDTSITSLRLV